MMARENIQPYAERERHRTEQQPEALCGVRREQHRRRAENAAGGIEQATIQKDAQAFYREQSS